MKTSIRHVMRIESTSMWAYLGYLANRVLLLASILGIISDLTLGGMSIPWQAYVLTLLCCVSLGWYELRNANKPLAKSLTVLSGEPAIESIAKSVRKGIEVTGGSLRLRDASISEVDVAIQARDAQVDARKVKIE